jgi:hypothetical protein
MSRHLMLVPSLACPASCAYWFGPHAGGPSMRQETVEAVVRWQNTLGDKETLEITFHGGEPLVPGVQFYRVALPLSRQGLVPRLEPPAIASPNRPGCATGGLLPLVHSRPLTRDECDGLFGHYASATASSGIAFTEQAP